MKTEIRKFAANKGRVMLQCRTQVSKDSVKRVEIDGTPHIVVSSATLPDDIVMNGILYPSEEIETSYSTLERTLAPVEHPMDSQGNFLSANDPVAIANFYAGAHNENVRRENGRVYIDKVINVSEAEKSERGQRLLERIAELETNEKARPIHTSVGVFLTVEQLDAPQKNDNDQEYALIAREMTFDHDAILLDSVGAATPEQGVGIAVNADGLTFDVEMVSNDDVLDQPKPNPILSHEELREALHVKLNTPPLSADYVVRVFDTDVVYSLMDEYFTVPYQVQGDQVTILGIPLPVAESVEFIPKTNHEGDDMKEAMLNALKSAGVEVDGLDEKQVLAAYSAHIQNKKSDDEEAQGEDIAAIVANALAPITERLDALDAKLQERANDEVTDLAALVGNSAVYPGIDAETAKGLGLDKLKELAANCKPAFAIPAQSFHANEDEAFSVPSEMPE